VADTNIGDNIHPEGLCAGTRVHHLPPSTEQIYDRTTNFGQGLHTAHAFEVTYRTTVEL
jgi:hypothetical protein